MRRVLAGAAIAAAAFAAAAPAPSQAFFCVWVGDICLPCGPVNAVYERATGGPLLYC